MASDDREEDEKEIFRVDTVPPPADGDAYSAPTKVGPVSQDAWKELIQKANAEGDRNEEAAASQRSPPSARGPLSKPPSSQSVLSRPPPSRPAPVEDIPRVYNDDGDGDDDEDAAATLLHPRSQPNPSAPEMAELPLTSAPPPPSVPSKREPPSFPFGPPVFTPPDNEGLDLPAGKIAAVAFALIAVVVVIWLALR
jgi:hypothetical protein